MKRRKMRKQPAAIYLAAMPMLFTAPATWAVDQYLNNFNTMYGTAGTKLDNCLVCHVTTNGGARNNYGADFEAAKTSNTSAGVEAALLAIQPLDSDQDTLINIDEITALTWPGDCTDPDPANCPGGGAPPDIPPGTITEGPTMTACYAWEEFPNERLAISIKRYGGLVTEQPRNDFIENQFQTSHGVHGKHVGPCGTGTVGLVDGSFIKQTGVGSHLGVITYAARGDGNFGGEDWCRSVVLDCVSEEDVHVPTEFKCYSRNEFDVFHGETELKQVENPAADPLCNAFETADGDAGGGQGYASGLNKDRGEHDRKDREHNRRGKDDD